VYHLKYITTPAVHKMLGLEEGKWYAQKENWEDHKAKN
jgi:aspartyl/asparaginyl beta-hydroxylase (cupin superfamily)